MIINTILKVTFGNLNLFANFWSKFLISDSERALGITLYELFTSKLPFKGAPEILKKSAPILPLEYKEYNVLLKKWEDKILNFEQFFKNKIYRMLEKNQEDRFDIIQVDREFKRINLKSKNIYEGLNYLMIFY